MREVIIILVIFSIHVNGGINMNENRYINYIFLFIGFILWYYINLLISKNVTSRTLEILHKNSLVIVMN